MHPFTKHSDALLHPEEMLPNAPALAVATAVWTRRQSGVLMGPVTDTLMIRGEPHRPEGVGDIVRALYTGSLVFRPGERTERPGINFLGPHLYEAGRRLADQPALRQQPDCFLVDAPGAEAARRLPLHPVTRAMLARRPEGGASLRALFREVAVDQNRVFEDIAVLVALGLLQLDDRSPRAEPAIEETPPPPRRARDILAHRLRRDWDRMQGNDDWGVVGVAPTMDERAIDRACDRMLRRYSGLVSDASLQPEARDLARLLHRRVGEAVARIRPETA
ncbi:MAG: hypothetical protein GY913_09990 [Proteobacteria bacterium]|nr:hypothetical protein [Pseudomonadota bacterium]MCP4917243.1 hypothetical protein [Pseudomonadota bacterium]